MENKMSKDAAVAILRQNGFKVKNEGGVVLFEAKADDYQKIEDAVKEIGYSASWGIIGSDAALIGEMG